MRIQHSPVSPSSSSSSPCSSSSSSSIHSTISTQSTTTSPCRRCQGLDLLVKAVYHVAGSVIGVPYIQRRVIRRRKPALRFKKKITPIDHVQEENDYSGGDGGLIVIQKIKKQSLKVKDRRRRRSIK